MCVFQTVCAHNEACVCVIVYAGMCSFSSYRTDNIKIIIVRLLGDASLQVCFFFLCVSLCVNHQVSAFPTVYFAIERDKKS